MDNDLAPSQQEFSKPAAPLQGCIGEAWRKYRAGAGFVTAITLSAVVVVLGGAAARHVARDYSLWIRIGLYMSVLLAQSLMSLGVSSAAFTIATGKRQRLSCLADGVPILVPYLIAELITIYAVVLGTVALIVPGIWIAVRLQFAIFVLLDHPCGPVDALRQSLDLTRKKVFSVLKLDIALLAINIAGALCFGVGLLVTVPLSAVVLACAYTRLRTAKDRERKAAMIGTVPLEPPHSLVASDAAVAAGGTEGECPGDAERPAENRPW